MGNIVSDTGETFSGLTDTSFTYRHSYRVYCPDHTSVCVYHGTNGDWYTNNYMNLREICRECLAQRNRRAQVQAQRQREAQLERARMAQKCSTDIVQTLQKQQTEIEQLQQTLEDNIKNGIFNEDSKADKKDEVSEVIQKFATINSEISRKFVDLSQSANQHYETAQSIERSVDQFKALLLNDSKQEDIPSSISMAMSQYKLRANNMKKLKLVLLKEFDSAQIEKEMKQFEESIDTTKNLLSAFSDGTKAKLRTIFHQEGIDSIYDLVGLDKQDLKDMGIASIHATKILKMVNTIKQESDKKIPQIKHQFTLFQTKLTKLNNAIKTVEQAYCQFASDSTRFITACNELKMQSIGITKQADVIEYIANNLDKLKKAFIVEEISYSTITWTETISSGCGSAGLSKAAKIGGGLAVGAASGAMVAGPAGAIVGGIFGALVGCIFADLTGGKRSKRRTKTVTKSMTIKCTEAVRVEVEIDRSNTKKALEKVAEILRKMNDQNKVNESQMNELKEDKSEIETKTKSLNDLKGEIKEIEEKLNTLKPEIDTMNQENAGKVYSKMQSMMNEISGRIAKVSTKMHGLK